MNIEEFLSKLQGVTSDGKGGWMACCPSHDDHNPSMHVNVGNDGRILVKCYAGCTTSDIVAEMGLKMSDLMAEKPGKATRKRTAKKNIAKPGKSRQSSKGADADGSADGNTKVGSPRPSFTAPKKTRDRGKLVCEYVYKREDGAAVFKVQRRVMANGKKTFVQMSSDPDAPGGWSFGVASQGVEYIPYQLPLIRKAAQGGKPVIVCEGEKDVCTLIKRLHLAATCNAKGAGKWQAGFGKYFEGVPSVLIIADKDAETRIDEKTGEEKPFAVGQRHACDVERKLRADGYQGKIRKIVMPDVEIDRVENGVKTVEMRHVKDFADWVEAMELAQRTVDKSSFRDAVEKAGPWPDKWNFEGNDLFDLQRAQKEARNTLFDKSEEAECDKDGVVDGPTDGMGDSGRFGRLVPHTPAEKTRVYSVDFQISATRRCRIIVGVEYFEFQAWMLSSVDHKFYKIENPHLKTGGPLTNYLGNALGQLYTFCESDSKAYKHLIADLQCRIVLCWMRSRGVFFADRDNPCYESSMFFNEGDGQLYVIRSAEFLSYLATVANISRKVRTFEMMMALIDDLAMNREETERVSPSRQWEKKDGNIYLSCGDSEMYRITPTSIDRVNNGTDGVLFLRGFTFAEWMLQDGQGLDPFKESLAFRTAAWSDGNSVMNIRLWYLNLFFCHKNKPLLLIEGPAGSGKTTIARLIKSILSMRDRGKPDTNVNTVVNTDKGAEDFWVIAHNGRLEVFDNLDQKIKWANNELQTVSTGGSHKGRQLYKTDDVYILYPNASLILTSNNPIFATEGGGLPDRIIQAHIGLGRKESFDNELVFDIERKRDQFMTWTARTLSVALADTKTVDQTINKRHPDYGNFSVRCARAFGQEAEAIRAMSAAEVDKAILPLMNETVAKEIYSTLLRQDPKGCMKFTSGEMSEAIVKHIGEDDADDKTKTIFGSRRVGKALSTFRKEFSVIFRMREPRIYEGKTLYEFEGLTAQGATIVASSSGGLVDLERENGKSPYSARGAEYFHDSNPPNPPNPPNANGESHARAGACSVNSSPKEEKYNGEREEFEPIDDWDIDL